MSNISKISLVWSVDIIDCDNSKVVVVTEIAESDASTGLQAKGIDLLLGDVEGDGDREEVSIDEAIVLNNSVIPVRRVPALFPIVESIPIVVRFVHETLQRRKTTVQDKLQIAQLPLAKNDGWEGFGLGVELLSPRKIAGEEILKNTTMGRREGRHVDIRNICRIRRRRRRSLKEVY